MAEGGSTGSRPRKRRWTAFLDDVAEGIAGAILSEPAFAAVVLLVANVANVATGLDSHAVGLAFLGGLALSRTDRELRVRIFAGWVALACAARVVPYEMHRLERADSIGMPTLLVFTILSAAWSAGGRRIWAVALSAAAAMAVWWAVRSGTVHGPIEFLYVGSAAFVVLFIWLGSRGWTTAAAALAGLAAAAGVIVSAFSAPGVWSVVAAAGSVAESFVAILGLTVCGMVARAARRSVPRDHGAMALTTFARRPWVSALFLGSLLRTESFGAIPWIIGHESESSGLVILAGVALTSAFLALIASAAAGTIALLAPLTAVCVFATIDWTTSNAFAGGIPGRTAPETDSRMLTLVAAMLLPQFVTWAATRPALRLERIRGFLVVGAVLAPCIARSAHVADATWVLAAWPVLVALVCASAVLDERPSRDVVAFGTLAGLASGIAFELAPVAGGWADDAPVDLTPQRTGWVDFAAVWFLASLLVVIARRARSFTTVPVDHPVFADFPRPS